METKPTKSICRVCLTADSKNVSLLEQYKDLPIYLHINSLSNVDIKENDGLPDKICTSCMLDLDTAISFKERCEGSDLFLRTQTAPHSQSTDDDDVKYTVIKKEEPHNEIECLDDTVDNQPGLCDNSDGEEVKSEINEERKPLKKLNKVELGLKESRAIDLHLQCDDCKEYFKSKCKLRVHWKKVHLKESLKCLRCKLTFKSFKAYNRHKQAKSRNCIGAENFRIEGEGKTRQFYCKECNYKSNRVKLLLTHQVIHTGDRKFKCDICFKSFGQLSTLNCHKEGIHPEYSNEKPCPYCAKMFPNFKMTRHLKTHVNKELPCPKCNNKFKNNKTLEMHMLRHSGVKSFACVLCAQTFYTQGELYNHEQRHLSKKVEYYKCDECDYKCRASSTLRIHKKKHDAKYMHCNICGRFFAKIESFQLHMKKHSSIKRYSCPYCDARFHNRNTKNSHIKVHHGPFSGLTGKRRKLKQECNNDE